MHEKGAYIIILGMRKACDRQTAILGPFSLIQDQPNQPLLLHRIKGFGKTTPQEEAASMQQPSQVTSEASKPSTGSFEPSVTHAEAKKTFCAHLCPHPFSLVCKGNLL